MDVAFLLFGLLAGVTGNHLYEEIPAEYEETVKLERLNGDGRLKRQDLDFPDTLEYSFNLKQDKKSLRLKRNTYVRDYVPLTLHRKGVNKRLTGYEEEFSKSAFYLDGETGAAVFLHCEDLNEDCSMYGMFHHKGEQYVVHPAENGFHRIKRALHDKIDLSYDIPERIDKSRIEKAMALKHIFREGLVEEHTIEISFFLDDSVYSYFLDKYKGNPTLALKWLLRYYVQAANEMHLRYRSVQETYPYFKINILLNEVVVMKELSDCPWIEHNLYSPDEVLISARDSFARWQNDNKDNYIQYDHALAITRRTLLADRGNGPQPGILGISYYDGVCANPEIAVSLEMDNYKGIFGHITAHEIGHNIGAYHDGTVGCDDVLMRVMGKFSRFPPNPRTTFNTWFFSDCSIRQFLYFFDRVVGKPSCTMDTLGEGAALEEQLKVPLGGETYTLDEQCQFSLGNDSFFLGYVGKYLCEQGIYCYNPEQNDFMSIYTFHHTKCGKRKKRYIDDGFGIWQHGKESLEQLLAHANRIHPRIKVELRWSEESVEFLDTKVILEDGVIKTDLFVKETDKHMYVDVKSRHPTSTKKAIPYGLGMRLKRICTEEKDYMKHRQELKEQLSKRGYSGKFIEKQLQKVDSLYRHSLLQRRKKEEKNDRVPLVLTYTRHLPDVRRIVNKHMAILYQSDRMKEVFEKPAILAFRRDRNLADILVHGKFNKIFNRMEHKNCDCKVCLRISNKATIEDRNGMQIKVSRYFGCRTENIVYGIWCNACNRVMYVGETERMLSDRIKEHLADVRHKRPKPVAEHFNNNGHSLEDLQVMILERCVEASRYFRRIREIGWIERLGTEIPVGLNKKANLSVLWREYQ